MEPELKEAVEEFLDKNKVVLFMKGTKQFPQCGFSNTCVQASLRHSSKMFVQQDVFQWRLQMEAARNAECWLCRPTTVAEAMCLYRY